MTRWIGAAVLALVLMFGASAIHPAAAASSRTAAGKPEISKISDLSAQRRIRHPAHDADRSDDRLYYYDRPVAYRPYPYVSPVPFFLGFGFGP